MEQNAPVSGYSSPTVQEDIKVEATDLKTKIICTVLKELKKDCALQTYANVLNAAGAAVGIPPVQLKLYPTTVEVKFVVPGIKTNIEISKDVINEVIDNIVESISTIGVENTNDKAFKEAALKPIFDKMPWLNNLVKRS